MSGYKSWQTALAEAFVRLEPRRHDSREIFRGHIRQAADGPLALSRVDASAHQVNRLPEHAARSHADLAFVNLHVSGGAVTRQARSEVSTVACDVSVVRTAEPFSIDNPAAFSLVCLTLPVSMVPQRLLDSGALRLSATQTGRDISALLQSYANLALDMRDQPHGAAMIDRYASLLSWAAEHVPCGAPRSAGASLSGELIRAEIRKRAHDPELSLSDISASFGVSERRVQQVLAAEGTPFRTVLRDVRLARAADILRLNPHQTVLDIALSVGFGDLSHFSRSFKKRYDCSPRDYRVSAADKSVSLQTKT